MLKAAGYAPLVAVLIGLAAFLPFDAWFRMVWPRVESFSKPARA